MKKPLQILLALFSCYFAAFSQERMQRPLADDHFIREAGAIVRGDTAQPSLALVLTGDRYAEGGEHIRKTLREHGVRASFFFTGNFYRNPSHETLISGLRKDGHYLGAHSDRHLLYCDWTKRDSLLVTREEFATDVWDNYKEMKAFGIQPEEAPFFLPPYEWYNGTISEWTRDEGLQLVNITYGTLSHADYTSPEMSNYRSSEAIYESILEYEENTAHGLNGFILLVHIGVGPDRQDKFYEKLGPLITELETKGYRFKRIDELLGSRTGE